MGGLSSEGSQGVPGGGPGGHLGSFLWSQFFVVLIFAGTFVLKSKGAFLAFFKILIISLILCAKARYAFCHVFVFFGDLNIDLLKNVVFP